MKKYFALFSLITLIVPAANAAAILFEPAVTYEFGDTTVSYPSPVNNSTGTASGIGFGARIGLNFADTLQTT